MVLPLSCGKLQLCRGLGACLVAGAIAAQPPPVPPELVVTSTLEPAVARAEAAAADGAAVQPGELIVSVRFTNMTEQVVDSIRITSAVPSDTRYVAESASGPGSDVLFSVDGGRTFGLPKELSLVAPGDAARAAEPADYTHVRWVLRAPLDAGASGVARFRAVPR